jgi:hypothetical protein
MCQVTEFMFDGHLVRAFMCGQHRLPNGELEGMDDRWVRQGCEDQMAEIEAEMARDAVGLHDPNQCDPRNVRRELKEPKMINLGMRVNRVTSRSRRRQCQTG